jgi:hypothetical protein
MGKTHGVARFDTVDGELLLIECSVLIKEIMILFGMFPRRNRNIFKKI